MRLRSCFCSVAIIAMGCTAAVHDDKKADLLGAGDASASSDSGSVPGGSSGSDAGAGAGTGTTEDSGVTAATALSCRADASEIASVWDIPGSTQFTADGTWSDGTTDDVTATATWSVAPDSEGTIAPDGTYTAPPRNAGPMVILVEWEGLTAECSVDTRLEATIDLVGDTALEAAIRATVPTLAVDCAPYVLYPYDRSRIPADFFSPEVQWLDEQGHNTFVITFETEWITIQAITSADSWTPTGDEWWAVADPGSGRDIAMTVLGGHWDASTGTLPDGLCGSPWSTELTTEYWGAPGAVLYWTPDAQGIWKVDIGAETADAWADISTTGQCVGCHSTNYANPPLFATARGTGGYGASVIAEVTDPLTSLAGGGREASFSALDPSGTRMVRADRGVLYLDDLTTDANLGTLPTTGWPTHPNWSPDGRWVAYSSCGSVSGGNDWTAFDCNLHIIEVLPGDTWGPDTALAIAPPNQSYYYPEFSPDSQWVAFTRNTNEDSYDAVTAELMITALTGSPPVVLANANTQPNATNSWPRWGPIVGDIGWLAFSSRRNYALRTSGNHQVWVTGVDLADVSSGIDGSAPPVWVPGQSITTGNHTPSFIQTQPE
ncbi:MAG: hypothetical protein CL927_13380 [Deltaproteobacteria bacterium]|nr:hypothetical protein [Deltaproteobacteria bacterium]